MSSYKDDTLPQCPFYVYHNTNRRTITCEGIIPDTICRSEYKCKKAVTIQINTFCRRRFKYCEIYNSIMEYKYPEDDEQ